MTNVATKKQPKRSAQVQPKSPMFDTVDELRRKHNLVDNSFTIHRWDGTRKVQKINKAFVYDEKGRLRSTNDILMDLNAIVHDDGASHFTI